MNGQVWKFRQWSSSVGACASSASGRRCLRESSRLKRLKVKPGDVFCIPLQEQGEYVAGKVISETNLNGYLVDIFAKRYSGPGEIDPDDLGDTLFEPILLSFKFTFVDKWKIVKSGSGSNADGLEGRVIKFGFMHPPTVWENGTVRDATWEEVSALGMAEVWFPERLVRRIVEKWD